MGDGLFFAGEDVLRLALGISSLLLACVLWIFRRFLTRLEQVELRPTIDHVYFQERTEPLLARVARVEETQVSCLQQCATFAANSEHIKSAISDMKVEQRANFKILHEALRDVARADANELTKLRTTRRTDR